MAREAEENLVHVSKGEGMRVVKLAVGVQTSREVNDDVVVAGT